MADGAVVPSSVYLRLQPSQSLMNDQIFRTGVFHNAKIYSGDIERCFFFGSKHYMQKSLGEGLQQCFAVDQTRYLRVRCFLRLSLYCSQRTHSVKPAAFRTLSMKGSHCNKHALGQKTCSFKLCSKEPHKFMSHTPVISYDSHWNLNNYRGLRDHRRPSHFHCCGAVADVGRIMALEWRPAMDEVLLAISVALAYTAGIITSRSPTSQRKRTENVCQDDPSTDNSLCVRLAKEENQNNADDVWSMVQQKLVAALDVVENEDDFDIGVLEGEKPGKSNTLSLEAIAKGPRLRLLWTTLDHLHKEMGKLSTNNKNLDRDDWIKFLSDILNVSVGAVCVTWLEKEQALKYTDFLQAVVNKIPDNVQRNDLILLNIKNTGKEDLHADLLFFLCFGSLRNGRCCHYNLLVKHATDILEDLVIALADGIATLFLELISMDISTFSESEWVSLIQPSFMSTRALERFRNEVSLNRWLEHNFFSVVAIYEDWFNLWILKTSVAEKPIKTQRLKHGWWNKINSKKMVEEGQLKDIVMSRLRLPIKRTKELRTLSGWRYYYSLYLEFSDIMGPLVRALLSRVGKGISFLLVSLIGRSLGLIYQGIRQSISWKS